MKRINLKAYNFAVVGFFTLMLVFFFAATPSMAQKAADKQQFPIVVVDVGKVFKDSKSGQEIDKKLRTDGQAMEKKMQERDGALKAEYEALITEAQGGKATKESLEKKEKALQVKIQTFQVERQAEIEKMNADMEKALKPLQEKTEKAIASLSKSMGFVMVVNSAAVVYAPDAIDLTAKVIAEVDKP